MRVEVTDACQGHTLCVGSCPEVFGLNDEGWTVVLPEDGVVPPEFETAVAAARDNCPEQAIAVSE